MKPKLSIIVPTWNNPEFLNPCVQSIIATGALSGLANLIIVNNGKQPVKEFVKDIPNIEVLEPGENLGWERGLQYGLKHTDAEFVCFQNDDTHIPRANNNFYSQLLWPFHSQDVAAVGPATTVASGWHSIFSPRPLMNISEVSFLIFFTVMLRRKDLDQVGGIDLSCPGGDDFDLSIRLRKAGKKLLINPNAFLIHHGFKTGTRVRGDHTVAGGWNSKEMAAATNRWLIQKHGFKTYIETIRGLEYVAGQAPADTEGEAVASFVRGPRIVELGCGFRKTVPQAIGIDRVAKDETCVNIDQKPCVADIQADVSLPLPLDPFSVDTLIARHVLEHCLDTVQTLKNWNKVLKENGRLIVAVPNEGILQSIPLNPEHVHAFTPESLKNVMELCGFKAIELADPGNGISFIGVYEKVFHVESPAVDLVLEVANA